MSCLSLAVLLLTNAAPAPLSCPFDARVRGLEQDRPSLEAITRALRSQPRVKEWLSGESAGCKVAPKLRVLRTLDGLSQRCATALVQLEVNASECKELRLSSDGGPTRLFALVAADAKGNLQPVWTILSERSPLLPVPASAPATVECVPGITAQDGGVAELRAIARDPSLRFDGCTLLGLPEETVRREVQACLEKSASASVTCRFYLGDPSTPACAVTTQLTEENVAVVHAGGLAPRYFGVGPPTFQPTSAYFELTDAGAQWLCNDLSLGPTRCLPLEPPVDARQGCTPPRAKEALLRRAAEATCPWNVREEWRQEVQLPQRADGASLEVERLVLDRGQSVLNEWELAVRLRDGVAALGRCAKSPASYAGAIGTVWIGTAANAQLTLEAAPGDEECLQSTLKEKLARYGPRLQRPLELSAYRFRLAFGRE